MKLLENWEKIVSEMAEKNAKQALTQKILETESNSKLIDNSNQSFRWTPEKTLSFFNNRAYTVDECYAKCKNANECGGFLLHTSLKYCVLVRSGCTDNGDAPVLRSFAESFVYGTWASVCEPDYTQFFVDAVSVIDTASTDDSPSSSSCCTYRSSFDWGEH